MDHTHGYPITGVSVRVEAIRKADGTGAASTYTDPTDGTFSLIGLTLDEELALLASNEYPDVDGYDPVYYDNATDIDWARTLVPTSATPDITDLRITLAGRDGRLVLDGSATAPDFAPALIRAIYRVRTGKAAERITKGWAA